MAKDVTKRRLGTTMSVWSLGGTVYIGFLDSDAEVEETIQLESVKGLVDFDDIDVASDRSWTIRGSLIVEVQTGTTLHEYMALGHAGTRLAWAMQNLSGATGSSALSGTMTITRSRAALDRTKQKVEIEAKGFGELTGAAGT